MRTATELAEALAAGETTSVAITQTHPDRIAEVDGDVYAFPHVDAKERRPAAESDERRAG
jgi:aspartyl-tRNA(Asn)/glutamyl-tRNA(Gln) amidotransferase subunit A